MDKSVSRNLKIVQWNARSLNNKLPEFEITILTTLPDVVAIQETWMKPGLKDPKYTSYDILRKDRQDGRKSGGIMLLIRKNLIYSEKKLNIFKDGQLEVQAITIRSGSKDIDILNIYNPNTTLNKSEFLYYKKQLTEKYIIVGDINAHHPQWEPKRNAISNGSGRTINSILNNINNNIALATPDDLPTYTNSYSGETSTIDLVFCPPELLHMFHILTLADLGSDHTPILSTIQIKPNIIPIGKRKKWIIEEKNIERWQQEVDNYPSENYENLNEMVEYFSESMITPAINNSKKTSNIVKEKFNKNWWNSQCVSATKLRKET